MKWIIEASKEDIEFARTEAEALLKCGVKVLQDNYLFPQTLPERRMEEFCRRAAYSRKVSRILFVCYEKETEKHIKGYDWDRVYGKSFAVRIFRGDKAKEKDFADLIWDRLRKPRVDLTSPTTQFEFYSLRKYVIACLHFRDIRNDFASRRPHKRPGFSPISMQPKLARALVNISGADKKARILDPFCGTGGILIEAGLMGIRAEGSDIDEDMLSKARQNLKHYHLSIPTKKQDACTIKGRCFAIVTDPPYGKNTRKGDIPALYSKFLINARKVTNTIVICMPSFLSIMPVIRKSGWKVKQRFRFFVQNNFYRYVLVLKK